MPRPVCACCGAENSWTRVYAAMGGATLNLLGLACRACGRTATQMFSLGDYVGFALIYGMLTGALLVAGVAQLEGTLPTAAIAVAAALVPLAFLPVWWAARTAPAHAAAAPREDLPTGRKIAFALVAALIIAGLVGGMLATYLLLRRG